MTAMVALVTGGAKRIGGAITEALARAGYAVVIHCHQSRSEAEALAEKIQAFGGKAAVVIGDLAGLDGVAELYRAACLPFGPPTLLVNNASVFINDRVETIDPTGFTANLAVNLQAPVLLARAFAECLPAGSRGAIVNLIDQRVLRPNPQFLSYTLAKSALHTATVTLAQALAPRIRVNAIGPGPTFPNTRDGADGFRREAGGTPLGKAVQPEAIAQAVLFLARAESVTGQMIAVDSGQHLGWKTPDIVE